ncbi:MAG: tetratricopeptide repeat protein [Deltaproteobacteria bacterium]|jgi:tetratricopeptide (TPR) repeat protein|nr:tetratricopeptide repeat protein [Deltaproteobacteria bacterium]
MLGYGLRKVIFEWPSPNEADPAGEFSQTRGYARAEAAARAAFVCIEFETGRDSPESMPALDSLGTAVACLGRFAEAEPVLAKALEISEKALGSEDPATPARSSDLALALDSLGRRREAIAVLEKAVETRERLYGGAGAARTAARAARPSERYSKFMK